MGPLHEELTCGFHDSLQIPLQPLADHLESVTYEIFEKDPVKYTKYQEAFMSAFLDFRPIVEERKVSSTPYELLKSFSEDIRWIINSAKTVLPMRIIQ